MKKYIFIALVLICACAISFAQNKIPIAVTSTFNQKFPDAAHIKWEKEATQDYEASFESKGISYSANFSDKGEWLETESPIIFSQLPESVKKTFNASHKAATVKAVTKIETSQRTTKYEVEIKHGIKTVELFYTADGIESKE